MNNRENIQEVNALKEESQEIENERDRAAAKKFFSRMQLK